MSPKNENNKNMHSILDILRLCNRICPQYSRSIGIKYIIDSIFPFINIIFSYLILDELIYRTSDTKIYIYIAWLLGLNLVVGIISKVFGFLSNKYRIIIDYKLSQEISHKSYTLDYEQIEDSDVMALITKAEEGSNSSGGLSNFVQNFYQSFISPCLKLIYAIIILVGLLVIKDTESTLLIVKILNNPLSALVILLLLIIGTVISTIIAEKTNLEAYRVMMNNIDLNRKYGYLYNICANYKYGKDIRLYSMQDMIISIMTDKKNSINTNWRKYCFFEIKYSIILNIVGKLLLLCSYIYVGLKAYYGLITIGSVVSYVSSITIIGYSIATFLEGYVSMKQQAVYLYHYFTYLNLPTKMEYGQKKLDGDKIEIEFKNVSFAYPKQEELILDNINFSIGNDEKIAIVGQNGAGKTTLIKLLCRLYEPTKGDILINGISIKEYTQESLYQAFSIVFQDFKLFSYSIKDNVACGEGGSNELVWSSLEKAGIKDRVEKMDKGIDTIIYQRNKDDGIEISGGEAQKISLARALYKDSPIVILDEPTSALDPIAEADIYSRFKDMVNGKTSVFISHRMSSCKFCDKIIVLEKGKIEEIGNHTDLVNSDGLYHRMWQAQAKYYN